MPKACLVALTLLYLLTSVDYHERSMGVGTKWQTTHAGPAPNAFGVHISASTYL